MQFEEELGEGPEHLYSLWSARKRGEHLPFRKDFTPTSMRSATSGFCLLERQIDGDIKTLFAGTSVDDLFGYRIAGKSIKQTTTPDRLDAVVRFYNTLIDTPCGGHVCEIFVKDDGRELRLETLYLPLAQDNGLVGIVTCSDIRGASGQDMFVMAPRSGVKERILKYAYFIDAGFGLP